jgi:hypothetical protein
MSLLFFVVFVVAVVVTTAAVVVVFVAAAVVVVAAVNTLGIIHKGHKRNSIHCLFSIESLKYLTWCLFLILVQDDASGWTELDVVTKFCFEHSLAVLYILYCVVAGV